jgi:hypothetical protein
MTEYEPVMPHVRRDNRSYTFKLITKYFEGTQKELPYLRGGIRWYDDDPRNIVLEWHKKM